MPLNGIKSDHELLQQLASKIQNLELRVASLEKTTNGEDVTLNTDNDTAVPTTKDVPAQTTEDVPVPTKEDVFNQLAHRMPKYLRELPPLAEAKTAIIPPTTRTMTFTLDFIRGFLGGVEWSPGLFYIPPSQGKSILPNRTFYLLDGTHQHYLPLHPGAHGAIVTAFFNENPEEYDGDEAGAAYDNVPVFICNSPYSKQIAYPFQDELNGNTPSGREGKHHQLRYTYYGTYSQTRWSDKLDYDRLQEDVPDSAKMHFAETLSEVGRPEWVTQALMKHFFAKPEYEGRLPKGGKMGRAGYLAAATTVTEEDEDELILHKQVEHDVQSYVRKLEAWEKDARIKVGLLRKENILEAFGKEDAADPPGLRLWWEYLECVGWDQDFYNTMVKEMLKSALR